MSMSSEKFNELQNDLLRLFPEELRGAMSYYAYEKGHSAGYEEVLGVLRGLVDAFEKPIKDMIYKRTNSGASLLKEVEDLRNDLLILSDSWDEEIVKIEGHDLSSDEEHAVMADLRTRNLKLHEIMTKSKKRLGF